MRASFRRCDWYMHYGNRVNMIWAQLVKSCTTVVKLSLYMCCTVKSYHTCWICPVQLLQNTVEIEFLRKVLQGSWIGLQVYLLLCPSWTNTLDFVLLVLQQFSVAHKGRDWFWVFISYFYSTLESFLQRHAIHYTTGFTGLGEFIVSGNNNLN